MVVAVLVSRACCRAKAVGGALMKERDVLYGQHVLRGLDRAYIRPQYRHI